MRFAFTFIVFFLFLRPVFAESLGVRTRIMMATFRVSNPKSTATVFVLSRPDPQAHDQKQFLLVTAAHVLEQMEGDRATIDLRQKNKAGEYSKSSTEIAVRKEGTPLWTKHPKADIAVMPLVPPQGIEIPELPLDLLVTEQDWKSYQIEPGEIIRCVGFPHAAQFQSGEAAFPVVRLGCVAGYPLIPVAEHPMFLVDCSTFEGDSGGIVYWMKDGEHQAEPALKILGLVHGQHFLDERYKLVYQSGHIRKRLGLGIVVHAQAIRETIDELPQIAVALTWPQKAGSSVSGCTPTRSASFEVAHVGSREATEAHSCGRQPAVSREERRLSREAVTAVHRIGVLSPLRGSRCPDLDFLGLTPKATCCRHFVAESVQLQKARARTLQNVASSASLTLRVRVKTTPPAPRNGKARKRKTAQLQPRQPSP